LLPNQRTRSDTAVAAENPDPKVGWQRAHRGMKISESDSNVFLGHAAATLAKFKVPESAQRDVVASVQSLKKDIVE